MTEEQPEPLSRVTPFMVAALVCDTAATDLNSGKKSLVGIFDRIHAGSFPTKRVLTLYFRVTDAQGRYQMHAKFVSLKTGHVLSEASKDIVVHDRLAPTELSWLIAPLEIPQPGRYEFQLWANGAYVGATSIVAESMPQQAQLQE